MLKSTPTIDPVKLVNDAKQEDRELQRSIWKRYREYLEASAAGKFSAADGAELGKLALQLKLAGEDVQQHLESLRQHKLGMERLAKLPNLRQQAAALKPKIEEWEHRRESVIKALDDEGSPMIRQADNIATEIQILEGSQHDVESRGPGKFPSLYGLGFDPPAAAMVPLSYGEIERNQKTMEAWSMFTSVHRGMKAGLYTRAKLGNDMNDAINVLIAAALVNDQNPRLWAPEGGWRKFTEEYPEAMAEDPRKKKAIAMARHNARGKLLFDDMTDEGKNILLTGVRFGWINQDYTPKALDAGDAESDQEAEVVTA